MSEKAGAEAVKKFLEQIGELDKIADEDPNKFSEWEIKFLDEQADRADEFGEKIYISEKQSEAVDKIYRKIVLGEDVRENDGAPTKKRNRSANRTAE